MAAVETIVNVCDLCGTEGAGVETHELMVDGKTVEAELCSRCWAKTEKPLVPVLEAGRRIRRRRRR